MRTISYSEALREALREEMTRDDSVLVMGEDIGPYGGAFGVTRGLQQAFGPQRVIDTPISEQGFVGLAVGASLVGSRPVVEIMFMDFITLAMDQLVNQAAKLHYVFGRQACCPLVLRTVAGGGRCYGPTHSQSLEAWFIHVPGLKVAAPSSPADGYRLLKAAIRDDNPVLFVEHKLLYSRVGPVPIGAEPLPFGKGRCLCEGTDLTVVAYSGGVPEAEAAVAELAERGVAAELIDLRTLSPLDTDLITASVRKTGRLLVVEEGCRTGGVSAEIGFRVFESVYDYLDAPVRRVTSPDVPMPASPALEHAALPDRAKIARAALEMLAL